MDNVILEDIFEYLPKSKLKARDGKKSGKYKFFTSSNIQNKYVDDFLYDGECLIFGTGGKASINYCNGRFATSTDNFVVKVNKKYSARLIYLYFKYNLQELENGFKGASIKHISKDYINRLTVPNYNLDFQNYIVDRLYKLQMIIDIRKRQIEELEEIVKSQFVEMFGNPILNEKGFPKIDVINVVKLQRGYDLPNQNRDRKGSIPVYGANGILDKHIISKCKNGIITGRSGTIGKVYYSFEEFWPLNTTLFSIENYGNNIIYLKYLLDMFDLKRFVDATGVPTLNRNIVHKQKIIDVPLELQNQFAEIVKQIDKQKFKIQESLEQIQILQECLMNKYL